MLWWMIQGSLLKRYMPCGKKNCKCKKGKLHGPFYCLTYHDESGRLRTLYIPKNKVEKVKEGIMEYKRVKGIIREISAINQRLLKGKG